jgi:hypothetical protein
MSHANNKKLSITFINTVWKSIVRISSLVSLKKPGKSRPEAMISNEASNEISMMPIVPGSFMYRKFIYPKTAVKTIIMVMRLYTCMADVTAI